MTINKSEAYILFKENKKRVSMKQIENITKNWKVNEQFSQIMHYTIYEGTELFLKNEIVKAIRAVGYLGPKEDREEVLKELKDITCFNFGAKTISAMRLLSGLVRHNYNLRVMTDNPGVLAHKASALYYNNGNYELFLRNNQIAREFNIPPAFAIYGNYLGVIEGDYYQAQDYYYQASKMGCELGTTYLHKAINEIAVSDKETLKRQFNYIYNDAYDGEEGAGAEAYFYYIKYKDLVDLRIPKKKLVEFLLRDIQKGDPKAIYAYGDYLIKEGKEEEGVGYLEQSMYLGVKEAAEELSTLYLKKYREDESEDSKSKVYKYSEIGRYMASYKCAGINMGLLIEKNLKIKGDLEIKPRRRSFKNKDVQDEGDDELTVSIAKTLLTNKEPNLDYIEKFLLQESNPTKEIQQILGDVYKKKGEYKKAVATYINAFDKQRDPKLLKECLELVVEKLEGEEAERYKEIIFKKLPYLKLVYELKMKGKK